MIFEAVTCDNFS